MLRPGRARLARSRGLIEAQSLPLGVIRGGPAASSTIDVAMARSPNLCFAVEDGLRFLNRFARRRCAEGEFA
jgi:hypothetical protein